LCIAGDGVALGYWNQPKLTAERFIPDPFSLTPGATLYRTGDRARWRNDGKLEHLGRLDFQVKIRGYRVELGEIETAIARHPAIRETVVIVSEEEVSGDSRLVAYLVAQSPPANLVDQLRAQLRAGLPDYMVPSAFVVLDALPLTTNGKIDRKALPLLQKQEHRPRETYVASRNSLEFRLIDIWERVLNVRPIGTRDDFFELGGHSLLAVRLFSEIRKVFDKELRLATLFHAPTIEQLANVISQENWTMPWSSLVAIQPRGFHPPFFCVHAHGGEVLGFRQLATYLGTDQPFYGLQVPETEDGGASQRGISDRAARYLQEIRSLQPEGPYFIGGHCYGARIAIEMARQLLAQNQEVALLALIDAYAPGYPRLRPWLERNVKLRIQYHFKNLEKLSSKEKLVYFKEKAGILKPRTQQQIRLLWGGVERLLGETQPRGEALSMPPHETKVYPGKITLFSPSLHPEGVCPDPDMGWDRLAGGGLEIHQIPGEFAFIIKEPAVRMLSEELKKCLSKAQSELMAV
jgi:thioesterase domain-containing protein/acyl carrier protein